MDDHTHRFCHKDDCGEGHYVEEQCDPDAICTDGMCASITNFQDGVLCDGRELPFGPSRGPLRLVDVNGDRSADLVFLDDAGLEVAFASGDGDFAAPTAADPAAGSFEVVDIDGDGVWEVVSAATGETSTPLHLTRLGSDGDLETIELAVGASGATLLGAATLDGSGKSAVVGVDGKRVFALLDPPPGESVVELTEPVAPRALAVIAESDTRQRLVLIEGEQLASISLGSDGQLQRSDWGAIAKAAYAPVPVDLNGNAQQDLAVLVPGSGLQVLVDVSPSGFERSANFAFDLGGDPQAASMAAADVNADGKLDLVVLRADGNLVRLLGDGRGSVSQQGNGRPWLGAVRWVGDGEALALGVVGHVETAFVASIPNPTRNRARINPTAPHVVVTLDNCLQMAPP